MSRLFSTPSAFRTAVRGAANHHHQPSFTRCAPPPSSLLRTTDKTTTAHRTPPHSRTFSSLPTLRPSCNAPAANNIFSSRRPTTSLFSFVLPTVDLVPTASITAHPALLQTQIRCGPRRYQNMNRPSRLIRNRRSGFLTRMKTKDGRKTLARRREKGRKRLGAA